VIVKQKHWLDSVRQRDELSGQVSDKLHEVCPVCGVMYLIIEALVSDALAYCSVDREGRALNLGCWHWKALPSEVPSLLLDHRAVKRRLVEVDYRVFAHNDISEFHCHLDPPSLEKLKVVAVGKVFGVG